MNGTKILLALLFVVGLCPNVFSQRTDTTWWHKPDRIQSITVTDKDKIVRISCWHANGAPMASGRFAMKYAYTPLTDIVILDADGNKVQVYEWRSGRLIDYLPGNIVKSILSAPLQDTAASFLEYYTNGTLKTRRHYIKDTGTNGIVFYPPQLHDRKIAYMYQQSIGALLHEECFYPAGQPYSVFDYGAFSKRIEGALVWYLPSGEVDTTAIVSMPNNYTGARKEGRRIDWWHNGKIKTLETYKNNYKNGPERSWYENGQLQTEAFYKNNYEDSVLQIWYTDGVLKYYTDYRPNGAGRTTLQFYPSGMMKSQEGLIGNTYDSTGNLLSDRINIGNYSRQVNAGKIGDGPYSYEGVFRNKRIGKWVAHDAHGRLVYSTGYDNFGLLHGQTIIWDTLEHMRAIVTLKHGMADGPMVLFYDNGKDTLEYGNQVYGLKNGIWRSFYKGGQLKAIEVYDGKDYEVWEKYDENNNLTENTELYTAQKLKIKYYYSASKINSKYVNHIGTKMADTYQYYPNGHLHRATVYQSETIKMDTGWFDNGVVEFIVQRRNGDTAFGRAPVWFANGQLRFDGVMKNGVRDGDWIYYNLDGSIASKPHFENGVEIIKKPSDETCFCNETFPALGQQVFYNSAETFMPKATINKIMKRFQLDSGYNSAFVKCYNCYPTPIIAFKNLKVWVDKDGMSLDFTPCKHGTNYSLFEINRMNYRHITNELRNDYRSVEALLDPIDLPETIKRSLAILDHNGHLFSLQNAFYNVTKNLTAYYEFFKTNYEVTQAEPKQTEYERLPPSQPGTMELAEQYYKKEHTKSNISFEQDLSNRLAAYFLTFFPKEKSKLASNPTDRIAIDRVMRQLLIGINYREVLSLANGSLEMQLEKGHMSINFPTALVAAYDENSGKPLLMNGQPRPLSFLVTYKLATYQSYPMDRFVVLPEDMQDVCMPSFTIGNTSAWIKPTKFLMSLELPEHYGRFSDAVFSPYNYPAHYTNLRMDVTMMPSKIVADLDDYLTNFMGVVIKAGELHLPGLANAVPITDMLMDAKELNGFVKIPLQDSLFTRQQLTAALKKAGFKTFEKSAEWDHDKEAFTVVYFQYRK